VLDTNPLKAANRYILGLVRDRVRMLTDRQIDLQISICLADSKLDLFYPVLKNAVFINNRTYSIDNQPDFRN
jgi:hypothetical protein